MKIAISALSANNLDAPFDPHFGRAANFVIIDAETGEWETHLNPAANASGGAGVQAAQFIANHGAKVVISGDFGPKAHQALAAAGIRMFVTRAGSIAVLVEQFKAKQLQEVQAPTHAVGLHGQGMGRNRGRGRR